MQVELPKSVRNRMLACLSKARRREVGGILMAEQVAPCKFRIVDFSLDNLTGSAAHFVRSPEHHREALEDFFARTGNDFARFNYLGEWHSHPNHEPVPSPTDINSMYELIGEEKNISFAILLIVKKAWWKLKYSATVFSLAESPACIQITAGS
jgi:integrative and conjugative element protein (TIGR02256 family)